MARARLIDRRLSKSKKFSNLKSDKQRLLYLMIYPFLDFDGKYSSDLEDIKDECVPKLRFTYRQIAESLMSLHEIGLLTLYVIEDKCYLQYVKFEDFQNLDEKREGKSKIPENKTNNVTGLKQWCSRTTGEYNLNLNLILTPIKNKEQFSAAKIKEWKKKFEDYYWKNYHKDGRKNEKYALRRFLSVCKDGELDNFDLGYKGYGYYLQNVWKSGFNQRVKYFSTFCTDYKEYIKYADDKPKARL